MLINQNWKDNKYLEGEKKELENEIETLKEESKKYERKKEKEYYEDLKKLKTENEGLKVKISMTNVITKEKNGYLDAYNILQNENNHLKEEHEKDLRKVEINIQTKLEKLKKKMLNNISETQAKAGELNSHYMDVSSKLTLLQNHQFLVQLEYQEQELTKLIAKNELLEKKLSYLKKEIEIHKEVEISLAEKNKKLIEELNKYKASENDKSEGKLTLVNSATNLYSSSKNSNNKTLRLENKIINLEKKLNIKQKEYIEIKDKSDSFEKILKNYEKKYTGLFKFFEECLNKFFNDEKLRKNKDLYIDLDLMKKGDFVSLNDKEKYSTLIILMKYLMPLIYSTESFNENNLLNNIHLKFYSKKYKKKITRLNESMSNNFFKKLVINKNPNHDSRYKSFDLPEIKLKPSM